MDKQFASIGARFIATIIDGVLMGIVGAIGGLVFGTVIGQSSSSDLMAMSYLLLNGLSIALSIGYYCYYQAKVGQTIGKKAMGIKVVTAADGKVPTAFQFFLREIIGKSISGLILGIGYLMAFWDPNKQALHDKIAGTYVVRVNPNENQAKAIPQTPPSPAVNPAPVQPPTQ